MYVSTGICMSVCMYVCMGWMQIGNEKNEYEWEGGMRESFYKGKKEER